MRTVLPTVGRIYSVGYEDTTLASLVARLAESGVTLLVDVRLTPISRRPGFSKRPLAAALAVAGIEYVHEPLFGNPPENRDAFRAGDPAAEQLLRDRLHGRARRAVEQLVFEVRRRPVAVLCVEREASRCHRRVITDLARELTLGLKVVDVA